MHIQQEALDALKERTKQLDQKPKEDKESKVGKTLGDRTTKKIIVVVLAFLFTVPLFTHKNWVIEPNSDIYALEVMRNLGPRSKGGQECFKYFLERQTKLYLPLIEVHIQPNDGGKLIIWEHPDIDFNALRNVEKEIKELPGLVYPEQYVAIYDYRPIV